MRRLVVKILKNETILVVASILALISCFIVPPDKEYAGYIHASTISQLICLMLVVCGFQRIGVFRIIGSRLLHHVSTARGLVITLISLTYFSGMLITNDVALVTFIPFAIAVLTMAHMEEHAVLVGTLMTVGANVGSMLTPIGNAHNLYLKALTGMPSAEMIGIMAPYPLLRRYCWWSSSVWCSVRNLFPNFPLSTAAASNRMCSLRIPISRSRMRFV